AAAVPPTRWAPLRDALWRRCAGFCEACGQRLPAADTADAHHRQARSQGGQDVLPNLVLLHASCHTVAPHAVHQRPGLARGQGLLVRRGADPRRVAVLLPDQRLVLLDDDGGYVTVMEGGREHDLGHDLAHTDEAAAG